MKNGVLFLQTHEGVQEVKNTEYLSSPSLQNNITTAQTGSKYSRNNMVHQDD